MVRKVASTFMHPSAAPTQRGKGRFLGKQRVRSLLFLTLLAGVVGSLVLPAWRDRTHFDAGEVAYESANCATALTEFDAVIEGWRLIDFHNVVMAAQSKRVECQAFQTGQTQAAQQEIGTALVSYTAFLSSYPDSPLQRVVRQEITALFKASEIEAIAQPDLCSQVTTLQPQNLIPAEKLPDLYHVCGLMFANAKDWSGAIAFYEQFLTAYPQHALVPDVKTALAEAIVSEAQSTSAGTVPPPTAVSRTARGTSRLRITNSSPEAVQVVLSGPQPRLEAIAPCTNCQVYTQPPAACPNQGTVKEFALKPGDYQVVVRSADGSDTRPFTGEWVLENGSGYAQCLYIVRGN